LVKLDEPILQGSLIQVGLAAVETLLSDLSGRSQLRRDPFAAIPFAQAARERNSCALEKEAFDCLDASIEALTHKNPALYGGYCGVAWLMAWLSKVCPERTETSETSGGLGLDDEGFQEIDEDLSNRLSAWNGPYDLISGLVGIGVYALERLPSSQATTLLEKVIDELERLAVSKAGGITWKTPPEHLPPHQRAMAPHGYYNLGLAHGVPGIIGFLGHVLPTGIREPQVRKLIVGAVEWTLAQQLAEGGGARYPAWTTDDKPSVVASTSWCYGGLGLSCALMIAARAVGNKSWENEATQFALMEAERDFKVRDACLCHGAAGNALIFQQLYEATSEERFLWAARTWIERTLGMQASPGIGGYRFWQGTADPTFTDDPSLLAGSAGVAAALLTIAGADRSWTRLLLVDIPK
jgi:hypothetical protein